MAVNTRQVTQYEIFRLYDVISVQVGARQEKGKKVPIMREERTEVAIFDDESLLKSLLDNKKTKTTVLRDGHIRWEAQNEWIEFLPTQDRFSLPLNPTQIYGTD